MVQKMALDLSSWPGVARPEKKTFEGSFVRLEPLNGERHARELFESAQEPGADDRFRYLFDAPPADYSDLQRWIAKVEASDDPLFFAVIDKRTGRAEGRQALMRIDSTHGVIEIGNILWGPAIARTQVTTEALFLMAEYVFEMGYRRFEWKCNDGNLPSKRAAERFGFSFEGIFRQHLVVKGRNRDTAWFSMIDSEWPRLREGYLRWLNRENFDGSGEQRTKLMFSPME